MQHIRSQISHYLQEVDLGNLEEPIDSPDKIGDGAWCADCCDRVISYRTWIAQSCKKTLDFGNFKLRRGGIVWGDLLEEIED